MKKLWIVFLSMMPGAILAQQKAGSYTVNGNVDEGRQATMVKFTISTGQVKDTVSITDGKFTFKGKVNDERQRGQILIDGGQSMLFYLEPGVITVKRSGAHYSVAGTKLNREYDQYLQMLNQLVDSANTAGLKVNQFSKEIWVQKMAMIDQFITKNPSSAVGLDMLNEFAIGYKHPDELLAAFGKLAPALKSSAVGKEMQLRIKGMGAAEIGDAAPSFTLPDTAGKKVSLASFRGKYVLIDFWATWCAPCMAEMPHLIKAYDQYKSRNFEIVGVSLDRPDSKALWLKVINRDKLVWKQVSDLKWWNSDAALLYNINSVPANFLVDPQGKIIAKNLRGEALETKLHEILQ